MSWSGPRRCGALTGRSRTGLTRFVGRQHELEALHQALAQAATGHGQVAALVGEAGVGKSRLAYEFVHTHPTQGWLVLESASVSYGKATPYFPVLDLLRRYCHLEEQDDPRTVRAKVTGQVLTLDAALQDTLPALLSLLEVLPTTVRFAPSTHRSAASTRSRRSSACCCAKARYSPCCWCLKTCMDRRRNAGPARQPGGEPAHGLAAAPGQLSPRVPARLGSKTYYTQLRLDPLPPASADEFLQALLGDDPSLVLLKQLLIARTEGNPFFLEERVHPGGDWGAGYAQGTAWQALPIIQVRPRCRPCWQRASTAYHRRRSALQTAAVIGTEVPFPLLRAIADAPEVTLHAAWRTCKRRSSCMRPTCSRSRNTPCPHEVAYNSLLLERRRVLHGRIVEALEALASERGPSRSNAWRTMPCGARCGPRPSPTASRPVPGHMIALRSARRWPPSSRPSRPSAPPEDGATRGWPSSSATRWETLGALGEHGRHFALVGEAEALARAIDDRARLGGCWPGWPVYSG